ELDLLAPAGKDAGFLRRAAGSLVLLLCLDAVREEDGRHQLQRVPGRKVDLVAGGDGFERVQAVENGLPPAFFVQRVGSRLAAHRERKRLPVRGESNR